MRLACNYWAMYLFEVLANFLLGGFIHMYWVVQIGGRLYKMCGVDNCVNLLNLIMSVKHPGYESLYLVTELASCIYTNSAILYVE